MDDRGGAGWLACILRVLALGVAIATFFGVMWRRYIEALQVRDRHFECRHTPAVPIELLVLLSGIGFQRDTDEHVCVRTRSSMEPDIRERG